METIILLPTYNEKENIRAVIPKIFATVPHVSVMVIDDNSPDGTAAAVTELTAQFPRLILYSRPKKEGLGRAYSDAFSKILTEGRFTHICTVDADGSHDPSYLPELIRLGANHDLVIGSRYTGEGGIEGWELWRKILSRGGNWYCRLVTGLPITDCTSGFMCLNTKMLREINFSEIDPSGYAFLMHLKYKIWKLGKRIVELPILFKSRLSGESKISLRIIQEGVLLPWNLIRWQPGGALPCPACASLNTRFWFTKNNCKVRRCVACQLIFIAPLPDQFNALYSADYFTGATQGFGYVDYEQTKQAENVTLQIYLDKIEAKHPNKGSILDIGAATGSFLTIAKQRGWQVAGVEISDYAAAAARGRGLAVQTGTLDNAVFAPHSFDVITLWDVFEHLPDPNLTLLKITKLLKPGGIVVMNMPNAGSAVAKILGRFWPLIIPPEHIRLFNPKNLSMILNKHDFTVIEIGNIGKKFQPAYIFQIMYTIRHQAIWRKISNYLQKSRLNRLSIPLNLRDNMFIMARQEEPRPNE